MKYLWDTNIVIYYLQQQFPDPAEKFIDEVLKENQPVLSAITEIELLCWKANTEKDIEIVHNFLNDSLVLELDQAIKLKTAELRKALGIKLPGQLLPPLLLFMIWSYLLVTRVISKEILLSSCLIRLRFKYSSLR